VSYSSTDGPDTWRVSSLYVGVYVGKKSNEFYSFLSRNIYPAMLIQPQLISMGSTTSMFFTYIIRHPSMTPCSEWCGNSTFQASYAGTNTAFTNFNIPAYFSEFGCNTSPPRLWTEVAALFSPQMNQIWSGGMAFSYFPSTGNFGMIALSPDGTTVTPNGDFTLLQQQYGNATLPTTPSQSSAGQTQFPACAGPTTSFLASNTLPPTPNAAACQCIDNSALSCAFKDPNSPNDAAIIGTLIGQACTFLGQNGGNCNNIGASGSAGQYGAVSFCDPGMMSISFKTKVAIKIKL
jgi:hypothetical protein